MVVGIVTEIATLLSPNMSCSSAKASPRRGQSSRPAPTGVRPIAMTTIAAILALLPLAIGLGQGSDCRTARRSPVHLRPYRQSLLVLQVMPLAFSVLLAIPRSARHSARLEPRGMRRKLAFMILTLGLGVALCPNMAEAVPRGGFSAAAAVYTVSPVGAPPRQGRERPKLRPIAEPLDYSTPLS